MEKLWLKPGTQLVKKGLPGNKLVCKTGGEPLLLSEIVIQVAEKNLFHWKESGKVMDQVAYDKFITVEPVEEKKSDKRIALEKEASELEIEFTDRTSGKELTAAIEAVKKELEKS